MFSILLLHLSASAALTASSTRICICFDCSSLPSGYDCADYAASTDASFLNKLKGLIKNKPDVELFLTDKQTLTQDFSFFGKYAQNILFSAKDAESIVKFTYSNTGEYTLVNLSADNIKIQFENDDAASQSYQLNIGEIHMSHTAGLQMLLRPGASSSMITCKDISLSYKHMTDISIITVNSGKNSAILMDNDIKELTFIKDNFRVPHNGKSTTIKFVKNAIFGFDWKLDKVNEGNEVTLIFKDITSYDQLPTINLINALKFTVSGNLPPVEANFSIINVIHNAIPSTPYNVSVTTDVDIMPISIYAPLVNIIVTRKCKFTGIINTTMPDQDYTVFISPTSDITTKTDLEIMNTIVGRISCISQYITFNIQTLIIPYGRPEERHSSPITFGFDMNHVTLYKLAKVIDNSENQCAGFRLFSHVTEFSTAVPAEIGIIKFPIGWYEPFKVGIKILFRDEMPLQNKLVHGFNEESQCISLKFTSSGGKYDLSYSNVSKISRRICYSTEASKCKGYIVSTTTETDLSELIAKKFVSDGMKNISFYIFTSTNSPIDLDCLQNHISSAECNIFGDKTAQTSFKLDGTAIFQEMTLTQIVMKGTLSLKVKQINLNQTTFAEGTTVTLADDTLVYTDEESLQSFPDIVIPTLKINLIGLMTLKMSQKYYTFIDSTIGLNKRINAEKIGNFLIVSSEESRYSEIESPNLTFIVDKTDGTSIKGLDLKLFNQKAVSYIEFEGDWVNVKFVNNVSIFHQTSISVTYTKAHQGDQIQYSGHGTFWTKLEYRNTFSVCAYVSSEDECSVALVDQKLAKSSFNTELERLIKEKEYDNITVYVAGSTKGNLLEVKLDVLNEIEVIVKPLGDRHQIPIKLIQDSGIQDINYSYTSFSYIEFHIDSSITELRFGQLEFDENCEFIDFSNSVNLYVNDLICHYVALNTFHNITITDNCILKGDSFPINNVDVYFINDEDANDLQAEFPFSANEIEVTVGNGKLILDKITFHITRSSNYDGLISFVDSNPGTNTRKFNVKYQTGSSIKEMPKINFDFSKLTEAYDKPPTVNFVGQWEDIYTTIFNISNCEQVCVLLEDIIPFQTHNVKHVSITATGPQSGCSGPIQLFTDADRPTVAALYIITTVPNTQRVNFTITGSTEFRNAFPLEGQRALWVCNSSIDVTVKEVDSLSISGTPSLFPIGLTLDESGISTVDTKSFGGFTYLPHNRIYIDCLIPKVFDEANVFVLNNNVTIYKSPYNFRLPSNITFEFVKKDVNVHGFNAGCVMILDAVIVKEDIYSFKKSVFYASKMPSKQPFTVEYSDSESSAELVVTDASVFDNLKTYLPSKCEIVSFTIKKELGPEHPVNLFDLQETAKRIEITGIKNLVNAVFPSTPTMDLEFTNVKLRGNANKRAASPLTAKSLTMTNIDFEKDTIQITSDSVGSLDLDADTLRELLDDRILTQYNKNVNVRDSNIITFTQNGWKIGEITKGDIELKHDAIPRVQFEGNSPAEFTVESGVTTIHPADVTLKPDPATSKTEITLSSGWKTVTNAQSMEVNTGSDPIKIIAPFYPVPELFKTTSTSIETELGTTEHEEGHDLVIEEGTIFSEQRVFNLTTLKNKVVTVPSITFKGVDVVLDVCPSDAQIKLGSAVVDPATNLKLGKTLVTKSLKIMHDATVEGTNEIKFDASSELQLVWTKDFIPELTVSTETVPTTFKIIFDGSDVVHKDFNNQFYRVPYKIISGDFKCDLFKNKGYFDSSISYFSNSSIDLVFELKCEETSFDEKHLIMTAVKELPDDGSDSGDSGGKDPAGALTAGPIAGIVVAAVVVVAALVGLVVYLTTKKKYEMLLDSNTMDTKCDTPKYSENTENL